jgi:pimeloyl-ACP methyl ester carboxylesterase
MTGETPSAIQAMARGAFALIDAMGDDQLDLLEFSIGSFVAQEIAPARPGQVRRMVLASAAPKGASGMHGWAPEVIGAVGGREPHADGYLHVFFALSPTVALQGPRWRLASSVAPATVMRRLARRQGSHSTTRCVVGACRRTHCCNDSMRSGCRSSLPTAMATA